MLGSYPAAQRQRQRDKARVADAYACESHSHEQENVAPGPGGPATEEHLSRLQHQVLTLGQLVKEFSLQTSEAEARANATHHELLRLRDVVVDLCNKIKTLQGALH